MPTRVELPKLPPVLPSYAKSALAFRRSGRRLPATELVVRDVAVEPERLTAYDRVCGFRLGDLLPATYPQVLALPLHLGVMTDDAFPFPLPGLVHVRNTITVRQPVRLADRLDLYVRAERLRSHPRGAQFDIVTDANGASVWRSRATYLARGRSAPPAAGPLSAVVTEPEIPERTSARWDVPATVGRRYASVAGDVNPIHLHPWAARLFGFPRALAHGMWSMARCLAMLEGRLPDAYTVDVVFKTPLLIPATVEFAAERTDDGWSFGVRSRDGAPHVAGALRKDGHGDT